MADKKAEARQCTGGNGRGVHPADLPMNRIQANTERPTSNPEHRVTS
jgi:hypothetical protein